VEEDEAGKLAAFRERFGRGWDVVCLFPSVYVSGRRKGKDGRRRGKGGEKEGEKKAEDVFGDFTLVGTQANNINRTRIPKTSPRKKSLQIIC
jgi:hypothetical protein